MVHAPEKTCPRCQAPEMKAWAQLTNDQKLLAERLPMSAEYSFKERKKHRFCARCWYEETATRIDTA